MAGGPQGSVGMIPAAAAAAAAYQQYQMAAYPYPGNQQGFPSTGAPAPQAQYAVSAPFLVHPWPGGTKATTATTVAGKFFKGASLDGWEEANTRCFSMLYNL